ncbi:MAG: PEP-CTERM sorting domain-containing protein [Verrucomicrobiia bacterium]|jgi:hypothetical protein
MKNHSDGKHNLRNDRSIWLTVAAIFSGCALASSANAQLLITDSTSAPSSDILTSQLTDLGPGTQDNNRDYMNNNGVVGQTFSVGLNSTLDAITVKGRGDSAMYYAGGPQPFVAGVQWGIQITSVGAGGLLSVLDTEVNNTYVPTGGGASDTAYLTYTLATPISLLAGQEYAFNLYVNDTGATPGGAAGQSWFGLAHAANGDSAAYTGGTAENSDLSNVNTPGNGNGEGTYGSYAALNPGNYSYVFAAIGTVSVPEPTTLALIGLGGLGLLAAKRRRA